MVPSPAQLFRSLPAIVGSAALLALSPAALAADVAAPAGSVMVWLDPSLPDGETIERADNKTGGTAHINAVELAFPPEPETPGDNEHIVSLRKARQVAYNRWDEFDVERAIARDLGEAVKQVELVRHVDDVEVLVDGLLFQGAAASRAFDANDFATNPAAADLRVDVGGFAVPRAWVDAWALLPAMDRESFERTEFIDTNAWNDFGLRFGAAISSMAPGTITWDPSGGQLWIDGAAASGSGSQRVRAGTHYLHFVRDGVVCGRARVDVPSGAQVAMPSGVSPDELSIARSAIRNGDITTLPASVNEALGAVAEQYGGAVYIATIEGGRPTFLAWGNGAKMLENELVTVVAFGEIGGGILASSIFEDAETGAVMRDKTHPAGGFSGGLGIELGISYFAIGTGFDLAITPGNSIRYANNAETENRSTSVMPQPWGGLGAYFLRPTGDTPTVHMLLTVGWSGPSHVLYGGRLTAGVPLDGRGNWFRVSLAGAYGPSTTWKLASDPVPEISGWLRIGLGARL